MNPTALSLTVVVACVDLCAGTAQLPEQDELLWDDGSGTPEYCLDQFPLVSKVRSLSHLAAQPEDQRTACVVTVALWPLQWQALGYTGAGLGFFALLIVAAKINNKAERKPFVRFLYCCLASTLPMCLA